MFKNNLAYEASAGSGKTFMLVVRYLSLLFTGAEPSKILALTFTNKAAREMSERIVETLEELEFRGELNEIVKVTGFSREKLLEEREKVLAHFLNAHTKIMTIDSFFTQILRKFSLYASLMPDFSTFASQHEQKLLSRFLKEVRESKMQGTLIELSLSSGMKLNSLIKLLEEFSAKKEELSKINFTLENRNLLEQRAMEALKHLEQIVSNCKGASATLKKAVVAKNFSELRAKSWVVKESLEYWVFKKCFTLEMNQQLHIIQESLKEFYEREEQRFFYTLREFIALYERAKKSLYIEDSELSFSDVTALVYEILHRIDDSEFLYFRLDAKIEHMLLDEFQDTSIVQYEILKPLIEEITSGSGIFENGSFFFVGDVKQSIYRFRGGVSALFGEVVKQNGTQVEKLRVNYRSQKEVIEFVNRTFQEKIENYVSQFVREEADGGYVEVIQNEEILKEVTTQVKKLFSMGANENNIAILSATNKDGEEIKNSLESDGIEVVTEITTKLINQKSVKALLEYLKYQRFNKEIYRENFFALISAKPQKISRIDLTQISLLDVVKNAIEKYKLAHDDFHLLRFLNVISNYSDVEALLFEYERLDTTAAISDVNGVRVLTVHKSKGLEYEHVIIMDRLKEPPTTRGKIIYEYEGISLESVYLRSSGRESVDNRYERALVKEQKLVREDSLNALYVAFTRAREHLIIVQKPEKSAFSFLDLKVESFGKLVLQKGEKEKKKALPPVEFKEFYYGSQSDLLEVESDSETNLDAINFGIALHYMLEMMADFTKESIEPAKNMMLNRFGFTLDPSAIEDIVQRVALFIENQALRELVRGKYYKEKALRYKNNLRYVDLLIEKEDGSFVVIDYKSSFAFSEHHHKQVHYYVQAIEAISGKSVKGFLCYLLADEIKVVPV